MTTEYRVRAPVHGGSFTDRVMARVADEPTPTPGRVFARSLRRLAVRDALAALATAWRLATEPAAPVAVSARASAAAFFLSVVVFVGVSGAFITSGVLGVLGPHDPAPIVAPAATPDVTLTPSPSPSPQPTPSATPDPTPRVVAPAPTERETPEPKGKEPLQQRKEKRETPEPKERERDERDERDEAD